MFDDQYAGKNLHDMSKEELIKAVKQLGRLYEGSLFDQRRILDMQDQGRRSRVALQEKKWWHL